MTAIHHARRAARYFESMRPQDLHALGDIYREDATFKDPFNEVAGLASIEAVYRHMFQTLDDPRFTVWNCTAGESDAWLAWHFTFRSVRVTTVRGATHLQFDMHGRIRSHRDYWDPAEELYAHVPVLGRVLGMIRRRLAAPLT